MTKRKTTHQLRLLYLRMLGLGMLCVTLSFTLGIQTAGEVQPVSQIEAHDQEESATPPAAEEGDVDGDGRLTINDAAYILEIVQGYRDITTDALKSDPNGDYRLTIEDALRVLRTLSMR